MIELSNHPRKKLDFFLGLIISGLLAIGCLAPITNQKTQRQTEIVAVTIIGHMGIVNTQIAN